MQTGVEWGDWGGISHVGSRDSVFAEDLVVFVHSALPYTAISDLQEFRSGMPLMSRSVDQVCRSR